jgi:hypothetical protein
MMYLNECVPVSPDLRNFEGIVDLPTSQWEFNHYVLNITNHFFIFPEAA